VLEAKLPLVGHRGVKASEAAVGHGQARIGGTLALDALGVEAGGEVGPVVVLAISPR
jgi:hypothetical protein